MADRPYKIDVEQVNDPTRVVNSDCNEIMFVNVGTTTVNIEKFPLIAGAHISFGGNQNEVDKTKYRVESAAVGQVWVFRKKFIN